MGVMVMGLASMLTFSNFKYIVWVIMRVLI